MRSQIQLVNAWLLCPWNLHTPLGESSLSEQPPTISEKFILYGVHRHVIVLKKHFNSNTLIARKIYNLEGNKGRHSVSLTKFDLPLLNEYDSLARNDKYIGFPQSFSLLI